MTRLENSVNSVGNLDEDLRSVEREILALHRVNAERRKAWELRSVLWRESAFSNIRDCGRVPFTEDGAVYINPTGKRIGFRGTVSCGSVWAEPVCSQKISSRRRADIGLLLGKALEHGSGAFGARTLRHDRGQSLNLLQDALSKSWRAVTQEKAVQKKRAALGWLGVILSREHTFTKRNGWHPHLHPAHIFEGKVTVDQVAEYEEIEFGVWRRSVENLGLRAPLSKAQHLHLIKISDREPLQELVDYLANKNLNPRSAKSVAWELSPGTKKTYTQTSGSLTPFDILEKISLAITERDKKYWLAKWHEYESATRGRSALTYSKGLRERFGLRGVIEDEVVLDDLPAIADVFDYGFMLPDWYPFKKNYRLALELLEAITPKGYWEEGRKFLRKHGIDFIDLVEPNPVLAIGRSRDQLVFDRPVIESVREELAKAYWEQAYL